MDELNLKRIIAKNITGYRKQMGWTQLELADKISYSDKSVSKWERAEGLPDIVVLTAIAELFGVTVNDLLSEERPAAPVKVQKEEASNRTRITVLLLSAGLVWFVAALVFFFIKLAKPDLPGAWYAFIVALPVCAIVVLVFSCLWWNWLVRCASVSVLVWTMAVAFDVMFRNENAFLVYVVAAVFQVLIVLWYFLMTKPADASLPEDEEEASAEE